MLAKYKEKLLDEFEARNDNWTYADFEKRLKEIKPNTYYQDAKSIIWEAHKLGLYPKTVKKYTISNYISFGNSSMGTVLQDVLLSLPENEKNTIIEKAKKNSQFD